MARLFGLIGNRADLAGRILASEAPALLVRRAPPASGRRRGAALGWGVGFYQGGEVLLRRRPSDDRDEIDLARSVADIRADIVLGHVRAATIGSLSTENTHPFRYRQWLFAQTGTIPQFAELRDRLIESVPEFLRGDVRGETDAEIVFHLFLSFLHDQGKLDESSSSPKLIENAIRHTMVLVDGLCEEVGNGKSTLNILVADGDLMVAAHAGEAMAIRRFSGKGDVDAVVGEDANLRRKLPDPAHMKFSLIASDFDDPPNELWKPVPNRAMVTLTRGEDPKITPL